MSTVWDGSPPTDQELIDVLEELLVFSEKNAAPQTKHWKFDPPKVDWKETYTKAGKRFPHLGLYAMPDPEFPDDPYGLTGDAIDDIADITQHTREMIWYAEQHNLDFAHDYFAKFHFHWSEHARDLLFRLRRGTDRITD